MNRREELERALEEMKRRYGEWSYDIPLPFGVWTRGNLQRPHTRLKRIVQVLRDLCGKPFAECRFLDLGCLEGLFSIELATQGAAAVGVEIREANVQKAIFAKEALGLDRLEFRQDDVRNVSLESYGEFDGIVASGILYHLAAWDAVNLVRRMYAMVRRVVVIDTHVALAPAECHVDGNRRYWGVVYREHADNATADEKAGLVWASADNPTSFWFTRPSLVNLLGEVGFSSVYECFVPAHLNFGQPGLEHRDRCTLVAIKGETCELATSPCANGLEERWPEESLAYAPEAKTAEPGRRLYQRVLSRLRKVVG